MKKMLVLICTGVTSILLLTACNFPSPTPESTAAPVDVSAETGETPPPSTLAPLPEIDLAGPALGSEMQWIDDSLLVFVPGGEFLMGKTAETKPEDHPEHPEHVVDQSGFWIYRSEVTNAMYAACVADGGCSPPATNITTDYLNPEKYDHPVVGVDWFQAQAYCSWADAHLPTEAQWEKTARGPDGNTYPWGEDNPACDLLNFDNCFGEKLASGMYLSTTSPIRHYFAGASYYKALDMAGNVFEWTQDWYQRDYYVDSPTVDPPGPADGEKRVVRSSAFRSGDNLIASVLRDQLAPDKYRDDLGFRCVVEHPTYYAPVCEYTPPPETCDEPSLDITDTSCRRKTGRVDFTVSEGATVTYPDGVCAETGPNQYSCYGASGGYVNVQVCSDCGPVDDGGSCRPTQCAPGYSQNPETCQCERTGLIETGGNLYSFAPSLALVPSLYAVDCPPGRYWDELAEMCVPAENPANCFAPTLMAVIPVECEQCPRGSSYNEESGCCEPSESGAPPISLRTCVDYTLQLGVCDTPPVSCTNPGQYSDQASCQAAGCRWALSNNATAVIWYCTYP